MSKKTEQKAPKHLKPATRKWWESVVSEYLLEPHHIRLLTLAAESWDRTTQARELLAEHGLTFSDRHGAVKPRPEVAIERDSRTAFCRVLRELRLDIPGPDDSRPPAITSTIESRK